MYTMYKMYTIYTMYAMHTMYTIYTMYTVIHLHNFSMSRTTKICLIKVLTTCFFSYKAPLKTKRDLELVSLPHFVNCV